MASTSREVMKLPHHQQEEFCVTRASYRQGRQLTAVKVYTVNDESQHLIISGVPSLGLQDDLRRLCSRFGDVKSLAFIPNYSDEEFKDSYHVQYAKIQNARFCKRQIDGRAFFGGSLHVCYAPDMETVPETRMKLLQRCKDVTVRLKPDAQRAKRPFVAIPYQGGTKKQNHFAAGQEVIWKGTPVSKDPRIPDVTQDLDKIIGPSLSHRSSSENKNLGLPNFDNSSPKKNNERCGLQSQHPSNAETKKNILQFVPTQVKGVPKRIIFHKHYGLTVPQPPNTSNPSLDSTIQSVRDRIRAVSVPNVKVVFEKG